MYIYYDIVNRIILLYYIYASFKLPLLTDFLIIFVNNWIKNYVDFSSL